MKNDEENKLLNMKFKIDMMLLEMDWKRRNMTFEEVMEGLFDD